MIIEVDKSFTKDFEKLRDISLRENIIKVIDSLEEQDDLSNVTSVKSIKWFKNYYRIRTWDYRIGFKMKDKKLILIRIRHRKDIYKIFP